MWLREFFRLTADYAPNRDEKIQLPGIYIHFIFKVILIIYIYSGIYTKEAIHLIYKTHLIALFSSNEHEPLSLSR